LGASSINLQIELNIARPEFAPTPTAIKAWSGNSWKDDTMTITSSKACAVANGVSVNGHECTCGNIDCDGTTGLYCRASTNTCGATRESVRHKLPNGNCCVKCALTCNTGLHKVCSDWIDGGAAKDAVIAKYGNIEDWNVADVTNMKYLFVSMKTFNADLSKWNVAAVTDMFGSTYQAQLPIFSHSPLSLKN
jgi:surface protein